MVWSEFGALRALHWPSGAELSRGGDALPPLLVIHGMFGSPENWASWGALWSESREVWAVQLPCHGSGGTASDLAYPVLAELLCTGMESVEDRSVQWIVLGHSLGAKAAMALAMRHPDKVAGMIAVDSAPRAYEPKHSAVFEALGAVELAALEHRSDAEAAMSNRLANPLERAFFLKALKRRDDGWVWGFDLPAIREAYPGIIGWESGTTVETYEGPALFVRGGKSDYIMDSDMNTIKALFPEAVLRTVDRAGHWVQAEDREGFKSVLEGWL